MLDGFFVFNWLVFNGVKIIFKKYLNKFCGLDLTPLSLAHQTAKANQTNLKLRIMILKVFKNKNFKKRDYETGSLVYAIGETDPEGDFWVESNDFHQIDGDIYFGISDVKHLYTSCGVRYFGYL